MNQDYLNLCLKEFPTKTSATAYLFEHFGFKTEETFVGDRFRYSEAHIKTDWKYHDSNEPVEPLNIEEKEIRLVQFPSGFWRYIPSQKDDMALVQEHLVQTGRDGKGNYIFQEFSVANEVIEFPSDFYKFIERRKLALKRELFGVFAETKCQEEKIYKISFVFKEIQEKHERIIQGILLFCEVDMS